MKLSKEISFSTDGFSRKTMIGSTEMLPICSKIWKDNYYTLSCSPNYVEYNKNAITIFWKIFLWIKNKHILFWQKCNFIEIDKLDYQIKDELFHWGSSLNWWAGLLFPLRLSLHYPCDFTDPYFQQSYFACTLSLFSRLRPYFILCYRFLPKWWNRWKQPKKKHGI